MSSRTRRLLLVPSAVCLLGGLILAGRARAEIALAKPDATEAERAIRALDEAFVQGYNRGESKAAAACFAENAEVVDVDHQRIEGRNEVEKALAGTFASSKGAKIAFEIETIRFLTPDVAKEEGRSVVTPVKGAPVSRRYTVLFVRSDGRWLISSVREERDPLSRPHDRLKDLEWMIGEWVDEGSDSVVRVHCAWSDDGNFLIRSFSVRERGKPVMSITQRIGWDPTARQIRSWEFDSEGGFGEGKWSRNGASWVVKHSGVRPEGTTASATNIMSLVRPDLVRWVSTERVVGDESLPDGETYSLVRVPPAPRLNANGPTTLPATPNTRSPR